MTTPLIDAEAHCDGPCGVYDPASARVAAEAVLAATVKATTDGDDESDSED